MEKFKTFTVTKKRDGQSAKFHTEFDHYSMEEAKEKFKKMMIEDLFEQEDGTYQDECGNEVWGFSDDGTVFSEDVYTYELTEKEATE